MSMKKTAMKANDETDADANTDPSPVVDLSLIKTVDNEFSQSRRASNLYFNDQ